MPRSILVAGLLGLGMLCTTGAFAAQGLSPCAPREIAQNIREAVLAFKASEFCRSTDLPYTISDAAERVELLRCNAQSSALIDNLMSNFDQKYKAIMTRDVRQVVCRRAAALSLH